MDKQEPLTESQEKLNQAKRALVYSIIDICTDGGKVLPKIHDNLVTMSPEQFNRINDSVLKLLKIDRGLTIDVMQSLPPLDGTERMSEGVQQKITENKARLIDTVLARWNQK